jgi:hypothetical protein
LAGANEFGDNDRWIPTTALDHHGAALTAWFGVPNADLARAFPNMGNFTTKKSGFV